MALARKPDRKTCFQTQKWDQDKIHFQNTLSEIRPSKRLEQVDLSKNKRKIRI